MITATTIKDVQQQIEEAKRLLKIVDYAVDAVHTAPASEQRKTAKKVFDVKNCPCDFETFWRLIQDVLSTPKIDPYKLEVYRMYVDLCVSEYKPAIDKETYIRQLFEKHRQDPLFTECKKDFAAFRADVLPRL